MLVVSIKKMCGSMKKIILFKVILGCSLCVFSQKKNITLEDIYKKGTFRTEYLRGVHSMQNGKQYTVMSYENGTAVIDLYSYETFSKTRTVLDTKDFKELRSIRSYHFSPDEKLMLLSTGVEHIYRRSSRALYYVYDINAKKLSPLSAGKQMVPSFSPDSKKVAFVRKNNIFVKHLDTNAEHQVTTDGKTNHIINGLADWVYEEEFSVVRMFLWSPNSDKIAYIKFDETRVKEISIDVFHQTLYPKQMVFKYPKAGEENSIVSLHFYNLKSKENSKVDLGEYNDFYIPRIYWTRDENTLCAFVMNRHQNKLDFLFINAENNSKRVAYTDTEKTYIELQMAPVFLNDNSFIWMSEKDGWYHLYHIDKNGNQKKQITKGTWEVTKFYGYDEKSNKLYYQSTEDGKGNKGINRNLYCVGLNGKNKMKLSTKTGFNRSTFSKNYQYYINTYSDASTPAEYSLHKSNGKKIKVLKHNKKLQKQLTEYNISKKEFFTLETKTGHKLNAYMMKPYNFDPRKKYPVFMTIYGGPGSQTVKNSWSSNYYLHMLTQKGYIVVSVDNRGTGFKGREFKKITYKQLGKYEIEDQIESAKYLGELPYVDKNRIGFFGWSFGGYMASLALTKGNGVFKMAIAVAPVTNWRFYDTIYTERYMQTPQENASGYDDNSPINYTKNLKGKYLLIHGSADDNVHYQNTMRMIESLVQADKQFDLFIYPDKNHGIYGGNTTYHLRTKITNFVLENL